MVQSFGDTIRGGVLRYITPLVIKLQDWIASNRELIKTKIESFIQGAVKAVNNFARVLKILSPVFSAVWEGVKRIAGSLSPLIARIKEWIVNNKDLIQTKIQEFAEKVSGAIERLVPWIVKIIEKAIEFAPVIAGIIASLWGLVKVFRVVSGVISIAKGVIAAFSSPITLIVLAVAALITGFVILVNKVGGVGNAFKVIGQTLMKWVLTPVNLFIEGLQLAMPVVLTIGNAFRVVGQTIMKFMLTPINLALTGIVSLLDLLSNIPGAGNMIGNARDSVRGFQDKMNTTLTGSDSHLFNGGVSTFADPVRAAVEEGLIPAGQMEAVNGGIQRFQDNMNTTLTGSTSTLLDSGLDALTQPYREAREEELLRQEAARLAAKGDEKTDETNDLLRQLLTEEKKNTEAVNGLGETGGTGVPGRLNYAQMGQEDFWSLARAGL
jgi:hypothetical protein